MVDGKNIGTGIGIAVGVVAGIFALPVLLTAVGLSAIGPVAGGLFAVA